jgi:hypothetical protein
MRPSSQGSENGGDVSVGVGDSGWQIDQIAYGRLQIVIFRADVGCSALA